MGSGDSRAGNSRAECSSTADGQRGGSDDSAGAGGSNGTSIWGTEDRRRQTRNFGRSSQFHGTDSAWRDWSIVFRSYAALVHPALKVEMQRVERLPTAENNAGRVDDEQVQASTDLYHFASAQHLGSCSGSRGERWVGRRAPCLAAVG